MRSISRRRSPRPSEPCGIIGVVQPLLRGRENPGDAQAIRDARLEGLSGPQAREEGGEGGRNREARQRAPGESAKAEAREIDAAPRRAEAAGAVEAPHAAVRRLDSEAPGRSPRQHPLA